MSRIKKDYCKKYKTSKVEKEHLISAVLRRIRKSGHRSKNERK